MLKLLLGTDWTVNTARIYELIASDVKNKLSGRILIVPETISHDAERSLCEYAGDTANRFAEVLSFSRLSARLQEINACGALDCMDNGGRVVVMASAAVQLHSKLKAYASVETRPEFLIDLIDAMDEFKRCCIKAEDLMAASRQSEGSLAQKLEELSLLLEAYDGICRQGSRDPRDQLTWLLEQLEESNFAQDHVFYFNGFTDFTGQQMAIIRHLIENSATVVISLNCDRPGSSHTAFEKTGETASLLLKIAAESGVTVEMETLDNNADALHQARCSLFQGSLKVDPGLQNCIRLYQTDSVTAECEAAASVVMEYVRKGARYRDIRLACTDMNSYANALRMSFSRRGIPLYIAGTEDILDMPIINTVLSALEASTNGFEQKAVMRYLRSYLSPLEMEECDRLENYAFLWNIHSDRWKKEWTNHPDGLGKKMDEAAICELIELNQLRSKALAPLIRLEEAFRSAVKISDQTIAVLRFLEDIQLAARLESMAERAGEEGLNANIQVFSQLWEILVSALEQLYEVLGHSAWDPENFTKLLKLLLSQYDVGTIPPVLDSVMAGAVTAIRGHQQKHLIVLGAVEGAFPRYGGSTGVLTEQERTALRHMGVPLTGGAMDSLQSELSDIFNVFCGARESITVSYPGGQPSYLFRRLLDMVGDVQPVDGTLGPAEFNSMDASAYLVRMGSRDNAAKLKMEKGYEELLSAANHDLGNISECGIHGLYGNTLYLSASKIDKVADCRLSYFLKYGLRAKERKEAVVDPAEFGTYVHDVLEKTAREVKARGGFHQVALQDTLQIANAAAQAYAEENFSQIDSERLSYLFHRNAQELEMIVTELWDELQECEFDPVAFELKFGADGQMDCIRFSGEKMQAQLEGFVDRVDVWNSGAQNYFRVVDYKTGKKSFDYCDVFNGLGLQMLLYMFALENNGESLLGKRPVPAGVQYFPARIPVISTNGVMNDDEVKAERLKKLKRKGLLLMDDDVLRAMEPYDKPVRMSYSRKKDGTLSGDLADRGQMKLLKSYVFMLLSRFVDDIASGCVSPNPYTRGSEHNACRFCPYGAVCHPAYVEDRRNYKTMSSQWFWEAVGKELEEHG